MNNQTLIFQVTTSHPVVQQEIHFFLSKYSNWLNFFFNININHTYFEEIQNGFLWIFRDLEHYAKLAKLTPKFIQSVLPDPKAWYEFFLEHRQDEVDINILPEQCFINFKCVHHLVDEISREFESYLSDIVKNEFKIAKKDSHHFIVEFTTRNALMNYVGFCYSFLHLSVREKYQLFKSLKNEKIYT